MAFSQGQGDALARQYMYNEGSGDYDFKLLRTTLVQLNSGVSADLALEQIPPSLRGSISRLRLYFPSIPIIPIGPRESATTSRHAACFGSLCDGRVHEKVVICRFCKSRGLQANQPALFKVDLALRHLSHDCSVINSLPSHARHLLLGAFETVDAAPLTQQRQRRVEAQAERQARAAAATAAAAAASPANNSANSSFSFNADAAVPAGPSATPAVQRGLSADHPVNTLSPPPPYAPLPGNVSSNNAIPPAAAVHATHTSIPEATEPQPGNPPASVQIQPIQPINQSSNREISPRPSPLDQTFGPAILTSTPTQAQKPVTQQRRGSGQAQATEPRRVSPSNGARSATVEAAAPAQQATAGPRMDSEKAQTHATKRSSVVERPTPTPTTCPTNKKRPAEEDGDDIVRKKPNVEGNTQDRTPVQKPKPLTLAPRSTSSNASNDSSMTLKESSQKEMPSSENSSMTSAIQQATQRNQSSTLSPSSANTPAITRIAESIAATTTSVLERTPLPSNIKEMRATPPILQNFIQGKASSSAEGNAATATTKEGSQAKQVRPGSNGVNRVDSQVLLDAVRSSASPTAGSFSVDASMDGLGIADITTSELNHTVDELYPTRKESKKAKEFDEDENMEISDSESVDIPLKAICSPKVGQSRTSSSGVESHIHPHMQVRDSVRTTKSLREEALLEISSTKSRKTDLSKHPEATYAIPFATHPAEPSSSQPDGKGNIGTKYAGSSPSSSDEAVKKLPPTPLSAIPSEASHNAAQGTSSLRAIAADQCRFPPSLDDFIGILTEAGVTSLDSLVSQVSPVAVPKYIAFLQKTLQGGLGGRKQSFAFQIALDRAYNSVGLELPYLMSPKIGGEGEKDDEVIRPAGEFTKESGATFPDLLLPHTDLLESVGVSDYAFLLSMVSANMLEAYIEYLATNSQMQNSLANITTRFSISQALTETYRKHPANAGMETDDEERYPSGLAIHLALFKANEFASLAEFRKYIRPDELTKGVRLLTADEPTYTNNVTRMFSLKYWLQAAYRELDVARL